MNALATPTNILEALIERLRKAKAAENAAKDARVAVEEEILAHFMPPENGEGSKSEGVLSIAWKITRTVDNDALQSGWNSLSANAQKAIKWEAKLDLKQMRALQDLDAPSYSSLARFITAKPAKPAITLKGAA